ncbi:hypothetical protein N9B82_02650 [Saprospiraceae bacterium]|nr:hypothetical protein [Saprospiraceae bacterium]
MRLSNKYNRLLAFIFLCSAAVSLKLDVQEKSKTFKKVLTVNESSIVDIEHRRGDLNIYHTNEKEAYVEVELKVRGSIEEDLQKIIDKFSIEVSEKQNEIYVRTKTKIESWSETNNMFSSKFRIKFSDGDVIKNKIESLELICNLYIPKIKTLRASNRYDNILWDNIDCDVDADIYSGKIEGSSIQGNVKIRSKYSKIFLGDMANGDLNIYNSTVNMGNAENLVIVDKYSKFKLKNAKSLDLKLHDSDLEAEKIDGKLHVVAKYSDLDIESCGSSTIDFHDSDIKLAKCGSMEVESKYSTYILGELTDLLMTSHDDNLIADKICGLEITDSKYSEYKVMRFTGALDVKSSHDDDYVFTKVQDFEGLHFVSKYSTLNFPLESSQACAINAELKYGSIKIDRSNFVVSREIEKDSKIELEAKTKGTNHKMVKVVGHDSKFVFD